MSQIPLALLTDIQKFKYIRSPDTFTTEAQKTYEAFKDFVDTNIEIICEDTSS